MDWKNRLLEFTDYAVGIFLLLISIYALIAVFEGTRSIFTQGVNRKSTKLILIGSLICIGWSTYSFVISYTMSDLLSTINDERMFSELPDDWGNNASAERRESNSKALASMYYSEKGKIGSYFNIAGKRKQFCPTEEDISTRDLKIETECKLDYAISVANENGWNWILYLFVASFFGWIASRKEFDEYFSGNS